MRTFASHSRRLSDTPNGLRLQTDAHGLRLQTNAPGLRLQTNAHGLRLQTNAKGLRLRTDAQRVLPEGGTENSPGCSPRQRTEPWEPIPNTSTDRSPQK